MKEYTIIVDRFGNSEFTITGQGKDVYETITSEGYNFYEIASIGFYVQSSINLL